MTKIQLLLGLTGATCVLAGCEWIIGIKELHSTDAGTADAQDTCNPGYYGDGITCSLPTSCADLLTRNPSAVTGWHVIDPDGDRSVAPFEVYCDMVSDEGGWTLIGDYVSNRELFNFDPTRHQLQNNSGGIDMAEPPRLDGTRVGHIAYNIIGFSTIRLQCRSDQAQEWFGAETTLISDWGPGDRGVYGGDHWVAIGFGNYTSTLHNRRGPEAGGYQHSEGRRCVLRRRPTARRDSAARPVAPAGTEGPMASGPPENGPGTPGGDGAAPSCRWGVADVKLATERVNGMPPATAGPLNP